MSLTGWLNSINRENQERWKELRYDQVAVDFVKTLRTFPVLKAWSDTFAEELLMKLDPEQCRQYQEDLEAFCSEKVDIHALGAIAKTVYIEFSAYHMLNPFRQRLEEFLKTSLKRSPGFLEDFYKKNEGNPEFQEDIMRSSRKEFIPRLMNFWKPEDIRQLTKIRDSLYNVWFDSKFENPDRKYVHSRLRLCLAVRMDMIEMSVAMNILGGDQWVEVLSSFLRRTMNPDGFDLTDEKPKDPKAKAELVKSELKNRSMVLEYLCSRGRSGIPTGYLDCNGRGLSIPPYETFYGPKKADQDTFKRSVTTVSQFD